MRPTLSSAGEQDASDADPEATVDEDASASTSSPPPVEDPAGGGARRQPAWRRLLASYVITVFFLITVNFLLPRAMPGDPISTLQGFAASTEARAEAGPELTRYYGLDRPIAEQYVGYLADLARGGLGMSIRHNTPVVDEIAQRLPWTLLLVASAMALATTVGLLAGVHSGWRRGRPVDRALMTLFMAIRNFPVFFLGSLALFVFAVKLRWFPLSGATTPFAESSLTPLGRAADIAHHLVLPASVLAVQFAAAQYLMMRAGMVGQLGSDYLLLGRAKGLAQRRLKYRYAARNAMIPIVTLVGTEVGFAVSVAILVETVFAYPGIGRLVFEAVAFRDYPVLQGCFLVLSLVVVSVNLLTDALYARLDPRTRA